jgi:hypothetical protein
MQSFAGAGGSAEVPHPLGGSRGALGDLPVADPGMVATARVDRGAGGGQPGGEMLTCGT